MADEIKGNEFVPAGCGVVCKESPRLLSASGGDNAV
jgi:hypothetical protein